MVGPGCPVGACCWINVAFCATAAGKIGATDAPDVVAGVAPLFTTDLLITLLMTVALWMLAKTTLLGGGAT